MTDAKTTIDVYATLGFALCGNLMKRLIEKGVLTSEDGVVIVNEAVKDLDVKTIADRARQQKDKEIGDMDDFVLKLIGQIFKP